LRLYKSLSRSRILERLQSEYNVSVIVPEDIKLDQADLTDNFNFMTYEESLITQKINKFVLDLETYNLSPENISFDTRIRLITKVPVGHGLGARSFFKFKSKYGFYLWFANIHTVRIVTRRFLRLLGSSHPGLKKACNFSSPDLILCFSGGMYSGVENFLCRYGRIQKVPIFLVIDNWDNLSSKSILWETPSLIGVWGPEMMLDASEIHKIPLDRIYQLGSSRIDLLESNRSTTNVNSKSPYVLFAGSGIQHIDEVEALLSCRLALNELGYSNLKIIYRPHPWMLRGSARDLDPRIKSHSGIELDPDIASKGEDSFYNFESLRHLEDLVRGCTFLIAGHSTVIVEALYFGKRVLAFTGSTHELFPGINSWKIYRHMERLSKNTSVYGCPSLELVGVSLNGILAAGDVKINLVPELIPEFDVNYENRLIRGLSILEKSANSS
jgi:hypothetical protein